MASLHKTDNGRYTLSITKKDNLIHIEAPNGIINVWVNLTNADGLSVDAINCIPDNYPNEPKVILHQIEGSIKMIREQE
jgi:hypothetical protein